ncbi:MAG: hypothetical protein KA296_13770 [Marinobacter sp.]|nr:hypothetical protein [Marinobacter sp.]
MEGAELILPMAGTAGVASWIGTMVANRTNLANLKARLMEVIDEVKDLRDRQHKTELKITRLENHQ